MTKNGSSNEDTLAEFDRLVNMTAAELDKWLGTENSKSVGWIQDGEFESLGHHSGRRIIEIKRKRKSDLADDDYAHMRKVIGYVHRHLAQGGPREDKDHSPWRYSLMNWGHDPKRK